MKLQIHIVTYREAPFLSVVLKSLEAEEQNFQDGTLDIELTHNGEQGSDSVKSVAQDVCLLSDLFLNPQNIGFCGAHNQGVRRFLESNSEALVILNPDLALKSGALSEMAEALFSAERIGMVCPLLLRADSNLKPLEPKTIDSAGMVFTKSLRHFDRYADKELSEVALQRENVSGASGACIMMKRSFVEDMLLVGEKYDHDLFDVFPELREGYEERAPFFDEAFFAYREDAELSLRAIKRGWRTVFVPTAIGYHVRRVTPERRKLLSADINRHGVRNRFLLQFLHWSPLKEWYSIIPGFLVRNLIVILGVVLCERSSFRALIEATSLLRRSWERRKLMVVRE